MSYDPATLSDAKLRLLWLLKRSGPMPASRIAPSLGTTVVAARQHLTTLEETGLVEAAKTKPSGRGRPSLEWSLTRASETIFPNEHAELAVGLIEAIRTAAGEPGLARVIDARADRQVERYSKLVPKKASLKRRVEALARERSREGYMAEVEPERPGTYLLIERHCPICTAARVCQGICRAELMVFRAVLGDEVEVERTAHMLAEGNRCVYRICVKRT